MDTAMLVFNGIDGDSGAYDLPPMSAEMLVRAIRGEPAAENMSELRFRVQQATTGHLGVKEGVDPKDLAAAGWGIVFPQYADSEPDRDRKRREVEAVREALQPLLNLRDQVTGGQFTDWVQGREKGFFVGKDTKSSYLARHGAGPGPADPARVPYYLLVVGSPEDIPYRFQSQLDVQYAVGRIHFDTVQAYADYAASVVAAETSPQRLKRQATFFGVANPDDKATQMSSSKLIAPLADRVLAERPDWAVQTCGPDQATKATLASLLGGASTPSLLVSASHGMKFDKGAPRQRPHQGALLCQDWPGPRDWAGQSIPQDFYFAGDDLTHDADLLGLIALMFACYGAGTPQHSDFAWEDSSGSLSPSRAEIAAAPFLARLPVQMLGRPRGALAVVGHVERAWSYSFDWGRAGTQTTVFESTLKRLLSGHPIGSAIEYFNERYAELSTVLSDELEEIDFGKHFDPLDLAGMWTANNDARGYAILGDPAVRLPVARDDAAPAERSAIEVRSVTVPSTGPVLGAPSIDDVPAPAASELTAASAVNLTVGVGDAMVVRTYVTRRLDDPPDTDLRIVTRRAEDGAIETTVHPDVAVNAGLLALHQALAGHRPA